MVFYCKVCLRPFGKAMPLKMAQSLESKHLEDRVDAALIMDSFLSSYSSWQQVGIDDKNASRQNGQFNKKSLELNNEKEKHRVDVDPFRYIGSLIKI